jgi:hypothetical protein
VIEPGPIGRTEGRPGGLGGNVRPAGPAVALAPAAPEPAVALAPRGPGPAVALAPGAAGPAVALAPTVAGPAVALGVLLGPWGRAAAPAVAFLAGSPSSGT